MTRIPVRTALALALAASLAAGCSSLADELEREADPARSSQPAAGGEPPVDVDPLTPPGPTDPAGDPPSVPMEVPCSGEGFKASAGMVSSAMGLRAMSITLTNCGTGAYEFHGYPALTVLDEQRDPVAIEVLKGTDGISSGIRNTEPKPILLQPGESVSATVAWRNTVTDAARPAPHGTYFDVAPAPGRAGHAVKPGDGGPIDIGSAARIGVSAWEKTAADGTPE
ncbi:DUF4232 domain-containing protein [Streptomyces indicus]|uniref:DUF4232 domain-containing protein n=1 Tax=Streptomyces indicus TaxID=417292 RepID=A0A1G8UQP0_9ACTN|nr:DUF4232 domain-containing protein [Streptomyces indicus]SDJ55425.1 Protein of unknown function [Streptomyces indicus]